MVTLYLILLFCVALGWLVHRFWAARVRRDLAEGAGAEYDRIIGRPAPPADLPDRAVFVDTYVEDRFPHFPGYALLTFALFLVGTPVLMALMTGAAYYAGQFGLVPQPGDVATEMYFDAGDASIIRRTSPEVLSYVVQGWAGFYYFFGLLSFWIALTFVVMRRYHRRSSAPHPALASRTR